MGLTVSARFKEELDIDIDFNAMFFEFPTVGDMKKFMGAPDGSVSSSDTDSSPGSSSTPRSGMTGATTPISDDSAVPLKVDFRRALEIVSEESGVATEDLTDDTDFSDSGIDSLLSLVIVSRFRDELNIDMQHEAFLMECRTVGDLRQLLLGDAQANGAAKPTAESEAAPAPVPALSQVADPGMEGSTTENTQPPRTATEEAALAARKKAVDELVEKYAAGFSAPVPSSTATVPSADAKVVLVTGASGNLGSHLTDQIARLNDVKQVVCLNRENSADPYARQQKQMRAKGVKTFDKIRPKLLVLQTDSAKPQFGLSDSVYEELAGSVTHLIHNAWPMSAKRSLAGFESQFQVMRNLIDFASDSVSRRPSSFKFSFEMVSSIGVVGHYGLGNGITTKTVVPEDRVDITAPLPNGYGDAKWGCERMLDATLHRYPDQFRTMAARLGQIAGNTLNGYWNPMEHFGFLVKSSQTLNALPDAPGTLYWTPVDQVAGTLIDLVLADTAPHPIYHIDNPVGQPWGDMNRILADAVGIKDLIPFEEWVERVRTAPQRNNPAATLLEFLDDNYPRMSCGGLVLDVTKTLEHSKTLAAVGPVSEEVARKYIHIWKEIRFLS